MGKKVKIIVDVTELGRKGGKARAANLSSEQLSNGGRLAAKARWDAYYKAHPEKLKTKRSNRGRKRSGLA